MIYLMIGAVYWLGSFVYIPAGHVVGKKERFTASFALKGKQGVKNMSIQRETITLENVSFKC